MRVCVVCTSAGSAHTSSLCVHQCVQRPSGAAVLSHQRQHSCTTDQMAGEHWRGDLAGALTSPGYEVNDLGFSYRTDRRDVQGSVRYLQNKPGKFLRRWQVSNTLRSESNYAGEPILTYDQISASATTLGYWSASGNVYRFFQAYDDRLTRGGPIARRPAFGGFNVELSTDPRLPVTGDIEAGYEQNDAGGIDSESGQSVSERPGRDLRRAAMQELLDDVLVEPGHAIRR